MKYRGSSLSINKVLLFIIAAIIVFVTLVTAAVFSSGDRVLAWRRAEEIPVSQDNKDNLTVLGQMRLRCKDGVLLLSVWFSHDKDDVPFTEELASKDRKIKAIVQDYFASYTQKELLARGEMAIKRDLLERINAELVLSKIDKLYFNQYIFLS